MEIKLICKKCGHDVTKRDVIYADTFCDKCGVVKVQIHCPCGAKLLPPKNPFSEGIEWNVVMKIGTPNTLNGA